MRRTSTKMGMIGMLAMLAASTTGFASTQHYIGRVVSGKGASAKVISTQISYISPKPPVGQVEMYQPKDARMFMVDGWFCDQDTFLAAVQPGQRLHLRNNRHQPILYALYSTKPFAAEGIIVDADPDSRTVTVRHMVDRKIRRTVKQTYTLPAEGVLRYEGDKATPAEALKKGRHVRAHPERKQTILAITPEAYQNTVAKRKKAWTNLKKYGETWVNEGYFAGYYHHWLFFTGEPFRDGKGGDDFVNTCQTGASVTDSLFTAHTLISGNFVTSAAAFRPGGRAMFVPDPIHSRRKVSHVILNPTDNGHIEGQVKRLNGNKLTLLVTSCPTGRSEDLKQKTVTITLADDARFHLNGKPGAKRAAALKKGNTVRVLPAWSGAMLVRDLDAEKGKVSGYGLTNKVTATVEQPVSADEEVEFQLHFGQVLFSPLSPAQYVDATFTWKDGKVHDLKLFNQRWPDLWKLKNSDINVRFDGRELTGWVEGHFSGGTISGYGKPGVYRFEIEARVRNNVLTGQIRKMTVDGTDAGDIKATDVGRLDRRFGGTARVGPSKGKTGLYRMVLLGGSQAVVYLSRDENGWGKGLAIVGGNRRPEKMMDVDPSKLKITQKGLTGSLRIKLAAVLLENASKPQWKTYHISAEKTDKPADEDVPDFEGRYRMVFGEDPLLYVGPGDSIIRDIEPDTPR